MKNKAKLLKELEDMIRHHLNILNDPMNACAEDFAEDYGPIEERAIMDCFSAGASDLEISHAVSEAHRKASEDYEKIFRDTEQWET